MENSILNSFFSLVNSGMVRTIKSSASSECCDPVDMYSSCAIHPTLVLQPVPENEKCFVAGNKFL